MTLLLAGVGQHYVRTAGEPVLVDRFHGPDGTLVNEEALWTPEASDAVSHETWLVESGSVERRDGTATTESDFLRMWSHRSDLEDSLVSLDVTFEGWTGGAASWHGINLWLNARVCTPTPDCGAVADDDAPGPSGYALDFVNRDGSISIQKKVGGDVRDRWPGATSFANGGTYYSLARSDWSPEAGRTYRFAGQVAATGDGRSSLTVTIDDEVVLEAVDDGSTGGPVLTGGRVGLRTDFARVSFDDLEVAPAVIEHQRS